MIDQFLPFRDVIIYSIGGGWGFDEPKEDTINVSVIRGTDMPDVRFGDVSNVPRRYEKANKAEKRFLKPGDLILEIAGGSPTSGQSTGRSILITEKVLSAFALPVIPASFCKLMRVNTDKVLPLYVYYALQDMYNSGRAHDYEQQSTGISNFQFEYFQDTETLWVPPLPEQRAIAEVLGALDDKIELNRRMNRTLEAMARAVFREMMKDESGRMKGGKIRDVCQKIENGGTPRRDQPEYWEPGTIPWLTSGEVRQEIIISTENKISEEGYKNCSAKMWSKGTTVVALYGATAGKASFIANELCANQACCGLVPNDGWEYFVYLTLSASENSLASQARGSAQQNLSQQIVADFSIKKPDQRQLDDFNHIVEPLFTKWIANLKESRTLAALRDALLPKLMRGEVRVRP